MTPHLQANFTPSIPPAPDLELIRLLATQGLRRRPTADLHAEREYAERELAEVLTKAKASPDDGLKALAVFFASTLEESAAELDRRARWDKAVQHHAPRRVTAEQAQALKGRVSLAALIGQTVTLRHNGKDRHIGLCPYHQEKTPSFVVYADGYHCFGCGASGDHFDWLRLDGADFPTAARRLAEIGGYRGLLEVPA